MTFYKLVKIEVSKGEEEVHIPPTGGVIMRNYNDGYMKGIDILAAAILAVGGLCWGAVGLFEVNPVEAVLGP